jgi:hypothetical protein
MPIGEASCRTRDENGLGLWMLGVSNESKIGHLIILDRESVQAEQGQGKRHKISRLASQPRPNLAAMQFIVASAGPGGYIS